MKKYIGWIQRDVKISEVFNNKYQDVKIDQSITIWNSKIKPRKEYYKKIRITVEEV